MLLRPLDSVYDTLKSSPFDNRRFTLRIIASYWLLPRLMEGRRLTDVHVGQMGEFGAFARSSSRRSVDPGGRVFRRGLMFSFFPSMCT